MRARYAIVAAVMSGVVAVLLFASPLRSRTTHRTVPPSQPLTADQPPTNAAPTIGNAREVAVRWVTSTEDLLTMGAIERQLRLEQLVVPSARAAMAASFETGAAQLAGRLPMPASELLLIETPITATARAEGTATVVEVWSVLAFGAGTLGAPRAVWRTTTVRLEAVAGRWMVASSEVRLGPTPVPGDGLPAAWPEFAAVASWPPVSSGGVGS